MARNPLIDVLGLGAIAIDDLIYVDRYPHSEAKVHVRDRRRHHGGQTGTALVAAARLGATAAYAGALGFDEDSESSLANLRGSGIKTSTCKQEHGLVPILSTIVVGDSGRTRAIFADTRAFQGADPFWPGEDIIKSTRVLFVDHWGVDGMIRAATIARASDIPVVADFERNSSERFPELLSLADHLVVGREFAAQISGESEPRAAAVVLRQRGHAAVIITDGANGCWAIDSSEFEPFQVAAFPVVVRDTTGCGDVFHGAYCASLAMGQPLRERLLIASASAALKAEKTGGQDGIPNREAIDQFRRRVGR